MSLGEKIKNIRKRFGLSQEELSSMLNVSRQAITKWETDIGLPDTDNLKALSKLFGITMDYLLNNEELPLLVMKMELDKKKYSNKIQSYAKILKEYYPTPWQIFVLTREKKKSKLESAFDFVIGAGTLDLGDALSDMSPYYLIKKDNLKLLVNINDWILEVVELNCDINEKRFIVGKNQFKKHQEIK